MTDPRSTHIDGYLKPSTGKAVAEHSKIVHVNPQETEETKARGVAVGDALAQEVAGPSGVSFLADGETAAKEYTLADGRRVGMNAETVELFRKFQEAKNVSTKNAPPKRSKRNRQQGKRTRSRSRGASAATRSPKSTPLPTSPTWCAHPVKKNKNSVTSYRKQDVSVTNSVSKS